MSPIFRRRRPRHGRGGDPEAEAGGRRRGDPGPWVPWGPEAPGGDPVPDYGDLEEPEREEREREDGEFEDDDRDEEEDGWGDEYDDGDDESDEFEDDEFLVEEAWEGRAAGAPFGTSSGYATTSAIDGGGRLGGGRRAPVVATLLSHRPRRRAVMASALTLGLAALVSALYWWGPASVAEALPASGEQVFDRGEGWRLFTAIFAHADAIHLLSNAVFLAWLIYLAYGYFGARFYPFSIVPVSALALGVTLEGYAPNIRLVGASGMLYVLAGAWLTLYALVERRLGVVKRLIRVVGFFLVVLVPTSIRPEVSYRAHWIGFFFGICLGLAWFLAARDSIRAAERYGDPDST